MSYRDYAKPRSWALRLVGAMLVGLACPALEAAAPTFGDVGHIIMASSGAGPLQRQSESTNDLMTEYHQYFFYGSEYAFAVLQGQGGPGRVHAHIQGWHDRAFAPWLDDPYENALEFKPHIRVSSYGVLEFSGPSAAVQTATNMHGSGYFGIHGTGSADVEIGMAMSFTIAPDGTFGPNTRDFQFIAGA